MTYVRWTASAFGIAALALGSFMLLTPAHAADTSDSSDTEASTTASSSTSFFLSRDSLSDTVGDARYVSDPGAIVTDDDFSAYETPMIRRDSHIVSIAATDRSVTMDYQTPARFLGVFHSHLITQATVNEDGSVDISHPWLSILYDENDGFDQAIHDAIESRTGDLLDTAAPSGSLPLSLKAQMLDRMYEAFEMNQGSLVGN